MNIRGHFDTITHHKLLVMKYCFECGLYRQGLTHDLSKYSPTEFIPGCIYYQGDHSPNEAERQARGYTAAWLHHKGRNRHHLEYWIDYGVGKGGLEGMKIPLRYICEGLGVLPAQPGPLPDAPRLPRHAGKAAENGPRQGPGAHLRLYEGPAGPARGILRNILFHKNHTIAKNWLQGRFGAPVKAGAFLFARAKKKKNKYA